MIENKLIHSVFDENTENSYSDEKKLRKIRNILLESQNSEVKNMPYLTLKAIDSDTEVNDKGLSPITFKANSSLREIMKLLVKIRYNLGDVYYRYGIESPERMSDLLRNLVIEEWERKKTTLLNIKSEINEG